MIAAIVISIIFSVIGIVVTIYSTLLDWKEWTFNAGIVTTIVSFIVLVFLALHYKGAIKVAPKEYPASEYTFKIKVVEFEEQRDPILVVTPKEK